MTECMYPRNIRGPIEVIVIHFGLKEILTDKSPDALFQEVHDTTSPGKNHIEKCEPFKSFSLIRPDETL